MTYDMEQFLRSCVDRYLEVAGNVELKKVPTPGPHEEAKDHPSRAPTQTGPSFECNWCGNRVPANGYETPSCQAGGTSEGAHLEPVRGQLAPHAASVLMKILYGARIARICSGKSTRWTTDDDEKLHHLMCYIHHTKHWRMIGWVGDSVEDMYSAVYADADFSGCSESLRSTSAPDLWWQGLSAKEGLHEHEGHDPVIVAKVPKLMRYQPPPTVQCPIGTRRLRSTWVLCGGTWEKVEDRVEPALQWERIDKYVERIRACSMAVLPNTACGPSTQSYSAETTFWTGRVFSTVHSGS